MDGKATLAFEEAESAVLQVISKADVCEEAEIYFYQLMTFHLSVIECADMQQKIGRHIARIKKSSGDISKLSFFSCVIENSLIEMTELLRLEMLCLYDRVCETPLAQS